MTPGGTRQVGAGLLVGLAVGVVLMGLVAGGGHGRHRQLVAQQRAVIGAAVVASAATEAWRGGGDVQAAVREVAAAVPGLVTARVVDIDQRRLLATTDPAEIAADSLPRPLAREQKDLYDRARELRTAQETNRAEGAARKDLVLAAGLDQGRVQLAVPVLLDGAVAGAVLAVVDPPPAGPTGRAVFGAHALLVVAGAALVFALAARRLRARPAQLALALALLAVGLTLVAAQALDGLARGRLAAEEAIRDHALAVRDATAGRLAAPAPGGWDLDRFGEPRGTIAADGTLDVARVRAAHAGAAGRFRQGFLALGVVAAALAAWVGLGWARRTGLALSRHRAAYGFVAPAMVGMLLLVFLPFVYGVVLSFTNRTLYNVNQPLYEVWTGLDNYVDILSDFDLRTDDAGGSIDYNNFYWTLGFTVLWTVTNVAIGVSVGLALALILNTRGLALRPVYRVLLILPWAVPNYITALVWRGMFHRQFGVVNQVLQILGAEPVSWFDSWFTSYLAVLTTNAWLSFPFMMVISLGALQSISADLYEAARVDGAARWQQFRFITLPSLKPALVPAVILSVIWTFNMFNIIYLVSGGQPAGATEILVTDAYKIAFEQYRYGYAAAYSTIIFLILLAYGVWQNRVTQATEGI